MWKILLKKTVQVLVNEHINRPQLDKDFILKYLTDSSTISNSDIQDIWVKLLLQENKQAGSVSKRTLEIVKNLSSREAKLFQELAGYSLPTGIICKDLIKHIPFLDVSKLKDIGLLKASDFITKTVTVYPDKPHTLLMGKIILIIKNVGSTSETFTYDCDVLTSSGLELKNALNIITTPTDFLSFCNFLKTSNKGNKNLVFSAHTINWCAYNNVNYNKIDLLKN